METMTDILTANEISKHLLDSIPAGIMLIDEMNTVRYANHRLAGIFNISGDHNLEKRVNDFIKCLNFSGGFNKCDKTHNCQVCSLLKPKIPKLEKEKVVKKSAKIILISDKKTCEKEILVTSTAIKLQNKCYALVLVEDITEISHLHQQLRNEYDNMGIWGEDPKIISLRDKIKTLAHVKIPVLISGESGTGKELVARAIHNQGFGDNKPFIPVNCAAIPDTLLESELFGHTKGAFTGATSDRKGRFALADGGTLFLDEIGDISPVMQVKLLRVLQEGTFDRIGDEKSQKVDVRIICATNKHLTEEIKSGHFREDLFYRISVFPLHVPPLRDRKNDIPVITKYLINSLSVSLNTCRLHLSDDALTYLMDHKWPGNIRELENVLKYAIVNCDQDVIDSRHLPLHIVEKGAKINSQRRSRKRKLERTVVVDMLERTEWNKLETAKKLNVSRATLYRYISDMDITIP